MAASTDIVEVCGKKMCAQTPQSTLRSHSQMRRYGSEFYQRLAQEQKLEGPDLGVGFRQQGGLLIATNPQRSVQYLGDHCIKIFPS